jgi:hypothetical protein
MKKIVLGAILAVVATAGAVYAYRTVQYNADHADQPFTFLCPLSGKPMCHPACTTEEKTEKAAYPDCCQKAHAACSQKPAQANP